jgi:lipopolysaccharide export system permease protein
MLGLLDRQMIRSYGKAYLVCLVSLVGLFVIVDLFTNLDDFTQHKQGMSQTMRHIGVYYANMVPRIFDQMCESIALIAATFTVAMMLRNNELLPLLSAGVSTRRVVTPVAMGACATLGLGVLNQELLLPQLDVFMAENRANFDGRALVEVKGIYDLNGVHLSGRFADKKTQTVDKFFCIIPPQRGQDTLTTLQAETARYIPKSADPRSGGWLLTGTMPAELREWSNPEIVECIDAGRYFLYTDVDFQNAIRGRNWAAFMTTWALMREMERPGNPKQAALAVAFHGRLTRLILGMTLVLCGLGVVLRDQTRNVFGSAGLCLAICAAFFAAGVTCQYLGNTGLLAPALSAWLPVIAFGPLALVLFDAVHT